MQLWQNGTSFKKCDISEKFLSAFASSITYVNVLVKCQAFYTIQCKYCRTIIKTKVR